MKAIQADIYNELDELYNQAKVYLEIWMGQIAKREIARKSLTNSDEKTNYNLALEFNGNAFRIRWFHYQFIKTGRKTVRVTKAIAIPESLRYTRSQFKYADDWELKIIEETEEVLYFIRYKVKYLMKMHRLLVSGAKYEHEPLVVSSSKDRVSKTTQSIKKIKEQLY